MRQNAVKLVSWPRITTVASEAKASAAYTNKGAAVLLSDKRMTIWVGLGPCSLTIVPPTDRVFFSSLVIWGESGRLAQLISIVSMLDICSKETHTHTRSKVFRVGASSEVQDRAGNGQVKHPIPHLALLGPHGAHMGRKVIHYLSSSSF